MMVIGKFGDKRFTVSASKIITFDQLSLSGALRTSTEDAVGKKPTTTIKGASLLKLSITSILNYALGVDVQRELDEWLTIEESGKAYPFILCGKAVSLNKFLLSDCKIDDVVISRIRGRPAIVSAKLSLSFIEYLPAGLQPSAKSAFTGGAVTGVHMVENNAYQMPTAQDKADLKRINPMIGG